MYAVVFGPDAEKPIPFTVVQLSEADEHIRCWKTHTINMQYLDFRLSMVALIGLQIW